MAQQYKRAIPVTINVGDTVMVHLPEWNSKLSPKFVGPCLVVRQLHGNKFEVHDPFLNTTEVVHCDRLKKTRARTDPSLVDVADLNNAFVHIPTTNAASHGYNLRSHN